MTTSVNLINHSLSAFLPNVPVLPVDTRRLERFVVVLRSGSEEAVEGGAGCSEMRTRELRGIIRPCGSQGQPSALDDEGMPS